MPDPTTSSGVVRRGRWLRRAALSLASIVLLVLFHGPLLTALGMCLVAPAANQPPDAVLLLPGDPMLAEVVAWHQQQPLSAIVLLEQHPNRLVDFGALPPLPDVARRLLAARGVDSALVEVAALPRGTAWDQARGAARWLERHPRQRLSVVCRRFDSRRWKWVFQQAVPDRELLQRIDWLPVRSPHYDERDWWRHKSGCLDLFNGWMGLLFVGLHGESRNTLRPWDPDEWARDLTASTAALAEPAVGGQR